MSDRAVRSTRFSFHLWMVGALSAALLGAYAAALSRAPQMDFQVYRTGGQHLAQQDLYSAKITVLGQHLLFTYPPFAAALFWPFSLVSSLAAEWIWDVINLLALAALIAVSSAALHSRGLVRSDWKTGFLLLVPTAYFLTPVNSSLSLGQVNLVVTLMILVDLTVGVTWRGRSLPRGVLVGLAAAIKLTPLVFVPYLLCTRQWRAARNTTLAFFTATAALFAVAPSASWDYFTKYAYDLKRIGDASSLGNQSLYAAFLRLHWHSPGLLGDLALLLVCVAGLVVAVMAFRCSSAMLGLLVAAATGLLVSPVSWGHHYVWIVPVLLWLVIGADRPAQSVWWAGTAIVLFVLFPLLPAGTSGIWFQVRGNCFVIPALAFVGLVATMLWSRARATGRDDTRRRQSVTKSGL